MSRNSAAVPSDDFVITDPAAELYVESPFESRYGKYSGDIAPQWDAQVQGTASRVVKGVVAGAVAGLAAGFAMVLFQKAWSSAEKKFTGKDEKNLDKDVPEHREHTPGENSEQGNDATIKTASAISETVFDHNLTTQEKKVAGPAVHYAFSAAMGALYGGLAELTDVPKAGFGSAFGAALFVGADEVAVPALGLSDMPNEAPLSKHLYGLVSHLVYSAVTEAVRRPLRKALDKIQYGAVLKRGLLPRANRERASRPRP
jgi:putative membrane protein